MLWAKLEDEYDVIVVGAGPGGSWAAKHCAEEGLRTLMIEKRQEIGSPVRCGEGMAKVWLDELGIKPNKEWIANEVQGARIYSPNMAHIEVNEKHAGNECGYVLHRSFYDKAMAREAARSGAQVLVKCMATAVLKEDDYVTGLKIHYMQQEKEVRAKVVVAADGFESQIARWAKMPGLRTNLKSKDANACFQYNMIGVDCDVRYNDFFVGSVAPGGYVWVFPKGEDQANVGIGVNLSKITGAAEAKRYLDKWIAKMPEYRKGKIIEQVCGGISCSQPVKKSHANGLILVGDAARMIDPLTGGGIANAQMSGMLAGPILKECIEKGDVSEQALKAYDDAWRAEMETQLLRNYIAKEKVLDLPDETFDKIISALSEVQLEKITTYTLLKALETKHPELVAELADLL